MTFKMLGFIIIILPHFWGFDHEKTKRPISTKLSQDLGACLKWIIFTSKYVFIQWETALLHNII